MDGGCFTKHFSLCTCGFFFFFNKRSYLFLKKKKIPKILNLNIWPCAFKFVETPRSCVQIKIKKKMKKEWLTGPLKWPSKYKHPYVAIHNALFKKKLIISYFPCFSHVAVHNSLFMKLGGTQFGKQFFQWVLVKHLYPPLVHYYQSLYKIE